MTPVFLQHPAKQFLAGVVDKMLVMDSALPPFIRLCNLIEYDRGILLAHFLKSTTNSKKNGKDLQANSKGLLMTAFQRAFRHFDAKHGLHTLSTMTSWKKHPSYKPCYQQCLQQLKKDASVPLADKVDTKSAPMDLLTYRLLLEYMVRKQNETYGVNLEKYCFYLNADFAAHTLMFGGPRGSTELAEGLLIKSFVRLEHNLLHFLQSGITKANQTGGDANFNVKVKPDLYFLGENVVHHFQLFQKRKTGIDGEFLNLRLFLKPLPSARFTDEIWFGNVHVGKNYIKYITDEMKQEGIIPGYLKFDNTSLRKLRTTALTDAGIGDWMVAESMGQKDKKYTNLSFYRKMDHEDKLTMAKVLADPWRFTKKRSAVHDIEAEMFVQPKRAFIDKENMPANSNKFSPPALPPASSNSACPNTSGLEELQRAFTLNNCSNNNITFNVYLGNK